MRRCVMAMSADADMSWHSATDASTSMCIPSENQMLSLHLSHPANRSCKGDNRAYQSWPNQQLSSYKNWIILYVPH